jgi:hypothetical protein
MERGGEYYDVRYIYFTYAYKKTLMLRVLLLLLFFELFPFNRNLQNSERKR